MVEEVIKLSKNVEEKIDLHLTIPLNSIEDFEYAIKTLEYLKRCKEVEE